MDVSATHKLWLASVGYRYDYDRGSSVINGTVAARLHPNLDAHASTNFDLREGRGVETRLGLDFRFQCFTITVEYVDRPKNENEIRVAVGLLGIGQAGTKFGAGGGSSPGSGVQ